MVIFFFLLTTRTFIAGDLAFHATVLGKENMSSVWCTWYKLSKRAWAHPGHHSGECWTIIKRFMELPLFDSILVKNYIIPVLHLLIGIGNNSLDGFLEWISERVEKLIHREVVQRNAVIYAEARYQNYKTDYDKWIEKEGIMLTDYQVQKSSLVFSGYKFGPHNPIWFSKLLYSKIY